MKTVNYEKAFGEYTLPEWLKKKLAGLPVDEQLRYFRTTEWISVSKTGWGTGTSEGKCVNICDDSSVTAVIIDRDTVVGIMIKSYYGETKPCFIGKGVCTYSASDNNGAGYTEREDYTYLAAISEECLDNL